MGVLSERTDTEGLQVDGGGFGFQVDLVDHTPVSGEGDLLNVLFSPDPVGVSLVSQMQSPSSDMDVVAFLFDEVSPVSMRQPITEGAWREVYLPVVSVVLSPVPLGLSTLAPQAVDDGFVTDVLSSSLPSSVWDCSGLVESLAAQEEVKLDSWRRISLGSTTNILFQSCGAN